MRLEPVLDGGLDAAEMAPQQVQRILPPDGATAGLAGKFGDQVGMTVGISASAGWRWALARAGKRQLRSFLPE